MAPSDAAQRLTVVDTSVLLNFLGLERLDLLTSLPQRRVLITAEVNDEVKRSRQALDSALASGQIRLENLALAEDAELFARLTRRLSVADASCIVAAKALGADLAADDRAFLRAASESLPADRLLGTEALLAEAVRAALLTLEEGDSLLGALATIKYRPKVASLRDLIGHPPQA